MTGIIRANGADITQAIEGANRQDQFLEQLVRDMRAIPPEVGSVLVTVFGRAIEQSVRVPQGNRREIAMLALMLAGAGACAAQILCNLSSGIERAESDRSQAVIRAFAESLKEGLKGQANHRLRSIMGSA